MSTDAEALRRLLEGYLREVAAVARRAARRGAGREALGAVAGRSITEDEEIGVDRLCDRLLDRWCAESGLDIEIRSEHSTRRPSARSGIGPEYAVVSDPFDGSGLFRRGLPAEWWSVLSVLDLTPTPSAPRRCRGRQSRDLKGRGSPNAFSPPREEAQPGMEEGGGLDVGAGLRPALRADWHRPIAGGAVDILRGELYLADGAAVTMQRLGSARPSVLRPARITALDDHTVIAAYLMDPSYLSRWNREAAGLVDALVQRFPQVRLWPNGGSCIYPWLARGLVHAYLMFDEPRSEIDPGLAFTSAAGLRLFDVQPDGTLSPYRYDPARAADRVPCFIAACTEGLAREIVGLVLSR